MEIIGQMRDHQIQLRVPRGLAQVLAQGSNDMSLMLIRVAGLLVALREETSASNV